MRAMASRWVARAAARAPPPCPVAAAARPATTAAVTAAAAAAARRAPRSRSAFTAAARRAGSAGTAGGDSEQIAAAQVAVGGGDDGGPQDLPGAGDVVWPGELDTAVRDSVLLPASEIERCSALAAHAAAVAAAERPTARAMLAALKMDDPIGVDTTKRGASRSKGSLMEFVYAVKRAHPTKVALVRVGEFYEAWGFDAVHLVEHCGLNPMGGVSPDTVPRAGCPISNLRRTLADLVDAGLSVAVCEEMPTPFTYGARAARKERFVAGVVSPASPIYCYGLAGEDADPDYASVPPVIAVACSSRGYSVCEVHVDLRRCTVTEGLTEEAAVARLVAGGFSPPLRVHASLRAQGRWEGSLLKFASSGSASEVQHYGTADGDFVGALLSEVRKDLALRADAAFAVTAHVADSGRPRPLYLATARQVGVLPTDGMPDTVKELLPPGTPAACRHLMRRLLLHPPQHEVAEATRRATAALSGLGPGGAEGTPDGVRLEAVPLLPLVPAAKIARLVIAREASHLVLADTAVMLSAVVAVLDRATRPVLASAARDLLPLASAEADAPLAADQLVRGARKASEQIRSVVAEQHFGAGALGDGVDEGGPSVEGARADPVSFSGAPAETCAVPVEMFASHEKWRGRVRRDASPSIANAYAAVDAAARELEEAVREDLVPAALAAEAARTTKRATTQGTIAFNVHDKCVWFNGTKRPPGLEPSLAERLRHPVDRYGAPVGKCLSTERVDKATKEYKLACRETGAAVTAELRALAKSLDGDLQALVGAATFAVVVRTMLAHAEEGARRGWCCPVLLPFEGPAPMQRPVLELRGTWPYWMDGRMPEVVRNDVSLSGLALLTGPNMAGKSTVSRTVAAVALFASCGLLVPAQSARVPRYDAFLVRQAGGDAPSENKSAFALEMDDARTVLRDATERSLVTLDEIGRGTEAAGGAGIAGAMLESLAARGAQGLFATHLHEILSMQLAPLPDGRPIPRMRMETSPDPTRPGRVRPTWRVVDGECTESLALQVAEDCGLPADVVRRAEELADGILASAYAPTQEPLPPAPPLQQQQQQQQHLQPSESARSRQADMLSAAPTQRPQWQSEWNEQFQQQQPLQQPAPPQQRQQRQQQPQIQQPQSAPLFQQASPAYQQRSAPQHELDAPPQERSPVPDGPVPSWPAAMEALRVTATGGGLAGVSDIRVLGAMEQPPPQEASGCSVVYLFRSEGGYFYAGETDGLRQRLHAHRAGKAGGNALFAYVTIEAEAGGKSIARAIESALQRRLARMGFPMLSTGDAGNRNFGG